MSSSRKVSLRQPVDRVAHGARLKLQGGAATTADIPMAGSGTGVIRLATRQVSTLFGYDRDEIVGRPVELLMPKHFHTRHIGHRESYLFAHGAAAALGLPDLQPESLLG